METRHDSGSVLVACPDARPPAYQAAIGLRTGGVTPNVLDVVLLRSRGTADKAGPAPCAGAVFDGWRSFLLRRHDAEIPAASVSTVPCVDLSLRIEARLAGRCQSLKRLLAQARTDWFDRRLARPAGGEPPQALFVFSDVGSGVTLPLCRRLGIPTVLSMVHGDVREEVEVLNQEAALAPDFFPIYLGDGVLDRTSSPGCTTVRLRDIALADLSLYLPIISPIPS